MSADFRASLAGAALNQTDFARLTGVTARTVRRWVAGEQDVPRWAWLLLAAWPIIRTDPPPEESND